MDPETILVSLSHTHTHTHTRTRTHMHTHPDFHPQVRDLVLDDFSEWSPYCSPALVIETF